MADDPRTATVHHPDKGTLKVTPEAAQALVAGNYGPYTLEPPATTPARPGQDPHDEVPDNADDVIAWIGDDTDRARLASDVENVRPKPRKTVTDHIESVLNPSTNDPAGPGQED